MAVVVALEYSCLASQHNSEIREPSTVPLNGKISPHRLLYRMHSLLLSFNPLSSYISLLSSFLQPTFSSFLPLSPSAILSLSSSPKPLLTLIPPAPPLPSSPLLSTLFSFLLSSSRVLVLNTPEPGHGSLGVPGLLI